MEELSSSELSLTVVRRVLNVANPLDGAGMFDQLGW